MESEDLVQVFGPQPTCTNKYWPHLLSTHYALGTIIVLQRYDVCSVIILILQMRELGHREVKKFIQGHTASKLKSQD